MANPEDQDTEDLHLKETDLLCLQSENISAEMNWFTPVTRDTLFLVRDRDGVTEMGLGGPMFPLVVRQYPFVKNIFIKCIFSTFKHRSHSLFFVHIIPTDCYKIHNM